MISVNQAKSLLKANILPGKINSITLTDALGLLTAEDICAPMDVPSFNNSAMDGYALAWEGGVDNWEVIAEVSAGDGVAHVLQPGKAYRIFTGAPIPKGADTVIPQEWVHREGNFIKIEKKHFQKGSNVRLKGAQTKTGEIILKKGSKITPGGIGLLASVGIAEIPVFSHPKVAIIITGNELQELGKPLSFGQIYNSNGPVLMAYLQQIGIKSIFSFQAKDEPIALQKTIDEALEHADVVLLSGGISVGDYDYVKKGLENAGVKELFYRIKQRPGKPLFAGKKGKQLVFALPGNPASVITCFNQYVKPSLLQWMGHEATWKPSLLLPLANPIKRKAGLTFFLKAKIDKDEVHILPGQESFNLIAFGTADCFAEVTEETEELQVGDLISVYRW